MAGLLFLGVVLIYLPVWFAYRIWDDDLLVFSNPCMLGLAGFVRIWTSKAADICPLTISTFWVEHLLWGKSVPPYHVVTILLHASCAVLLGHVLLRLRVPGAWLGAALWAFHPLQVESVAWIAEMKNTESGLFYLLSILFFLRWKESGAPGREWDVRFAYGLSLLFAVLAMACKSSTVILPVVLTLCAWRLEGRWQWRNLVQVAPMLVSSAVATAFSMLTQGVYLAAEFDPQWVRTWPQRIAAAGDAIWFYLGKLVWPYPLMTIYPRWSIDAGEPLAYLPLVLALGVLFFLWIKRHSGLLPVFLAFAYFVVVLSPGLGLADNAIFRYSLVFDHLQYLAGMGPLALVGAGLAQAQWRGLIIPTAWRIGASAALLLTLALLSSLRATVYQNQTSYWTDAITKNPACWIGYNDLGNALEQAGDLGGALAHYQRALILNPRFTDAYNNVGFVYIQAGQLDEGMAEIKRGLEIDPNFPSANDNFGTALLEKGKTEEAIAYFHKALTADPDFASAHNNLASAYNRENRPEDALRESRAALALDPDSAENLDTFSVALVHLGQFDEAISACQKAIRLNPRLADAYNTLGFALVKKGRLAEAMEQFQAALQVDPSDTLAKNNLASLQAALRNTSQ